MVCLYVIRLRRTDYQYSGSYSQIYAYININMTELNVLIVVEKIAF